jgi:hypothetical protein
MNSRHNKAKNTGNKFLPIGWQCPFCEKVMLDSQIEKALKVEDIYYFKDAKGRARPEAIEPPKVVSIFEAHKPYAELLGVD